MEKNKELAKNAAIITVGKLCTQFLNFLLLPLYTAILTTSEYGTVDLLTTYQQLISYVVFCQVEQALFRFLMEKRGNVEESGKVFSSCLSFALGQAAVLGVALLLLYRFTGYEYAGYLYGYVLSAIFVSLMQQTARGFGHNGVYALGSFLSAAVTILFNILFLVVLRTGLEGMLLAHILGNAAGGACIFLVLKLHRYLRLGRIDPKTIKLCLMYSLPLVPNVLSWWVMSASDRTIVAFLLGTGYNGLLTVAHKFPTAFSAMYTIFNLSWTESASLHIGDEDAREFFHSTIHRGYRLFAAIALGIVAVMPFLFPLLIHKNYAQAYNQIPLYMIAALAQVFQGLYSVLYIALKKTKSVAKSTVVAAVLNVVIHLALIKYLGLYAAAISSVAAYLVMCLWRYFDLKKYMSVPFDGKLLLSSAVAFGVACAGYYSGNRIVQLVCLVLVAAYCLYLNRDIVKMLLKSPGNIKNLLTGKTGGNK